MRVDLPREYAAVVDAVRQPHLDRLRSLGVTPETIASLGLLGGAFGVASVETFEDGTYAPGVGPVHVVSPVFESGHLVDLCAWRTEQPSRWWLRTGAGWALGADDLLSSAWCDARRVLFASPLDWLKGGGVGGVVLDWDSPDLLQLRGLDTIRCASPQLADTLCAALRRPHRIPNIELMEARLAA